MTQLDSQATVRELERLNHRLDLVMEMFESMLGYMERAENRDRMWVSLDAVCVSEQVVRRDNPMRAHIADAIIGAVNAVLEDEVAANGGDEVVPV